MSNSNSSLILKVGRLLLCGVLVMSCGKKTKKDEDTDGSGDGTSASAPKDFIVNGEVCPSLHCPSGVFTLPTGGSVNISAHVDTNTTSVISSDTTGNFDSTVFTDGAFIFTTTVASGESRLIKFYTTNSAGVSSLESGVTISATPGSLTLAISPDLTSFAGPKTANGITMVAFGATPVRSTWTTLSQSVQLMTGFSGVLKGINP